MNGNPDDHHPDCDYRNSMYAKQSAEATGVDVDEHSQVFDCNLGCESEARLAAIYSGAERYNTNCTKVVVCPDEVEPYRVYIVTNEYSRGQRRDNKWTSMCSWKTLEKAEKYARGISDSWAHAGAHYLGHGPF